MAYPELTPEYLRSLLNYDPATGIFTWKPRRFFKSHQSAGADAGRPFHHGYIRICIHRQYYLAHRLAWLYVHGVWPTYDVDHKDGNKSNNQINNLRDVTKRTNQQNQIRPQKNNKLGFLGVTRHPGGKFRATIRIEGRHTFLGLFDTPKEAHQAYLAAKREYQLGCTI